MTVMTNTSRVHSAGGAARSVRPMAIAYTPSAAGKRYTMLGRQCAPLSATPRSIASRGTRSLSCQVQNQDKYRNSYEGYSVYNGYELSEGQHSLQADRIRVRFVVPGKGFADDGKLRIVGSLKELGEWNPDFAPQVQRQSQGEHFMQEVLVSKDWFDFKVVAQTGKGATWENGENRKVHISVGPFLLGPHGYVRITCPFNRTDKTDVTYIFDKKYCEEQLHVIESQVHELDYQLRVLQERRILLSTIVEKEDHVLA